MQREESSNVPVESARKPGFEKKKSDNRKVRKKEERGISTWVLEHGEKEKNAKRKRQAPSQQITPISAEKRELSLTVSPGLKHSLYGQQEVTFTRTS